MAVPYTFGSATSAIPLSQLDSNFASTITLGNTAIQLGNTVTILNNMTFANVTISSGSVTITNATVTNANVTTALTLSGGTANGVAYLNGSNVVTTGSALTFDGSSLNVSSNIISGRSGGADGNFVLKRSSDGLTVGTLSVNSASSRLELATAYDPITFSNYLGEQMRLTSTGLGIGTSSPAYKLDVQSASNGFVARFKGGSTGQAGLFYSDPTEVDFSDAAGLNNFGLLPGSNVARIVTNGAERMRIDSSGNLLVGTTSSSLMGGKSLKIDGGTDTTGGQYSFLAYHNNASYYFGLNNNGYLQASAVYGRTTASAANVNVDASGYITRSTSALKYKQDIRDIEEMDINLLRPVRYKSKCDGDDQTKDHLGVIADEAADAGFEELVTRGADGEVEGFQYERLTVVLLKEIQSLRKRLATLESK